MKRLTERDEFNNADIVGVETSELQFNLDFESLNKVTAALNKLADYEDSEQRWNRMKGYIESIKNSMDFGEMTATDVIECILQQIDYQETIDDEGNCIYLKKLNK